MADNSTKAVEVKKIEDKSNYEWISIPATDLFGESHTGVSINFEKFTPELDAEGRPTGKDGRYFLDPEKAEEVRRLLQVFLQGQMRIMQPGQDKKMVALMNKGNKLGAPSNANF